MWASVNGTTLFYAEHGSGPPMLVLHGGLGLDQATLRPWLDPLGQHARLIFLDVRGCGQSDPVHEGNTVTHATWADDADALRVHLGVERWTVFGHSYGSFLALEYALRYPERLEGLVLCSSAPALAHTGEAMATARQRGTPEVLSALEAALAGPSPSDAAFEAAWRAVAPLYLHRPAPGALAAITDGVRYRAGAFNASMLGCAASYDVRGRLGEIAAPTLVLSGRHDWICPPEHGALPLARGIPGAEVELLEDSGHFPFVEEPERFLTVVSAWLGRHRPEST